MTTTIKKSELTKMVENTVKKVINENNDIKYYEDKMKNFIKLYETNIQHHLKNIKTFDDTIKLNNLINIISYALSEVSTAFKVLENIYKKNYKIEDYKDYVAKFEKYYNELIKYTNNIK